MLKEITKRSGIERVLSNLALRNERLLLPVLRQWMNFAQKQIRRDLVEKYQKSVTSELTNWELIQSQGKTIIKPAVLQITQTGGNAAYRHLAIAGSFDVLNVQAVRAVDKFVAKLVVEVTAQTKKGIRTFIRQGIKEGLSMPKIARELRPLVGLTGTQTQSIINYRKLLEVRRPDLTAAQVDKATMKYTNKTHRLRMENIARTETARAQNIGYCQGLEEMGVKEAEFNASPNACEAFCVPLNGTRYKVEDAAYIIPVHPRCECAMLPVVEVDGKSRVVSEPLASPPPGLPAKPIVTSSFTETVSPNFKALVAKRIDDYPANVKFALHEQNIKFSAGKKLTEMYPELKGVHPRGWPAGTTWDSVEGIYKLDAKTISVAETYRPIRQKVFINVPEVKIKGILNHETGHGFDWSKTGKHSETAKFKTAYRKDRKLISDTDIYENNLSYLLQKTNRGREEAFAEVFANLMGQGALPKDVNKFFPNTTKYVKDLLK